MKELSPNLAALFANSVYDSFEQSSLRSSMIGLPKALQNNFNFGDSIKGITGTVFDHLFKLSSEFGLIAQGKEGSLYDGHHVIALRGTATKSDIVTDLHVGITVTHNGSAAHAGFAKSFRSIQPILARYFSQAPKKTVHCVGHSLGGALATLAAEWIKSEYKVPVYLYTFGSPRVGLQGFAVKSTNSIDEVFRCTHGADPVPMGPVWPFYHTGHDHRLNSTQGFSAKEHKMAGDAPGYINTASQYDSYNDMQLHNSNQFTPVRLQYEKRHFASFSLYWAQRLNNALITLLRDAGVISLQFSFTSGLTFYDAVARALEEIGKISDRFAEQQKGLLGNMLVFAGKPWVKVTELSYKFIRWVLDITLNQLFSMINRALALVK
ncbi:lipase family protein [Thalassomonas haliotis]|uniref:Lipase family protein n=1 Tax=Thalassomonas haliotis TaxID=485448 RepID=A0ABY7VH99_9GAMM|nr:lipase family protein [Thalassomonas haliotis]WDE12415.1 lipase family protein [Thalassomonas haliotis]